MKITYSNSPCNKQKNRSPSFKAITAMACVITVMVAIKVFYSPEESMEDVAAMANSVIEEKETEEKQTEALQTSVLYFSPVSYEKREEEAKCFFPLEGIITSAFAQRTDPFDPQSTEFHKGIDIAPEGEGDIIAYADATVLLAEYDLSYGNFIKLKHNDGTETIYAHCSSLLVSKGERVNAGQNIAVAGDSGEATGVHLHFEIRINGEAVDPMKYFENDRT